MIWQNPWAWLGLLALVLPVLIHLLGRRSARAQRFPTLRFIESTPPVATRRTRITDIPLLLVRMGILAAAVAALALPLLLTADRERELGRALARAIIVDTSASMTATLSTVAAGVGGESGMDAARREAARLAADAGTSVIIETPEPASALAGAAAWLGHQHGRRDVIIISDFQRGTIDSIDVARVPGGVGITLTQVATAPLAALPASLPGGDGALTVLASTAEATDVAAARRAAAVLGPEPALPAGQTVALVYADYPGRDSLLQRAAPLSAVWQGDLLARLRADAMLQAAAAGARVATSAADSTRFRDSLRAPFTAVARTSTREPALVAAADTSTAQSRLLIFLRADAASLLSAATFAALARAASPAMDAAELEPSRMDPATLASMQRPAAAATSTRTADDAGESDGRWLWLLALALLGVETWMRRDRRQVKAADTLHERAA